MTGRDEADRYYTISEIADLLDEPPQRISYIARKLRLKPVQRIGLIRLFDRKQKEQIRQGCFDLQVRL